MGLFKNNKKTEIDYFYLTLNNGVSSIKIGEKEIPILGILVAPGAMHEVITGKKIDSNIDKTPTGTMTYISAVPVPKKEAKSVEEIIFAMTIPEKEEFEKIMKKMRQDIEDQHFVNSSYGLGEMMMRRLMVKAKREKEE